MGQRVGHKRFAGTAGVPPVMSAKREKRIGVSPERLRACGAFAGGTPAVPANHMIGFGLVRAAAVAVVLVEFAVEGLAPNAERLGGVSFIAFGVIKCSLNCLPFDFIH
jgi:hypothetical protein